MYCIKYSVLFNSLDSIIIPFDRRDTILIPKEISISGDKNWRWNFVPSFFALYLFLLYGMNMICLVIQWSSYLNTRMNAKEFIQCSREIVRYKGIKIALRAERGPRIGFKWSWVTIQGKGKLRKIDFWEIGDERIHYTNKNNFFLALNHVRNSHLKKLPS